MREAVRRLTHELTGGLTVPPLLAAAVDRLESTRWPEVLHTWSRLTPSGFPVEFTVAPARLPLRWTAEVAGPEFPERDRLPLTADLLARSGQPVEPALLEALLGLQSGVDLDFGAWIGGREAPGKAGRLKLYAELPEGAEPAAFTPQPVREAVNRLPKGTTPWMFGAEPVRNRTEIYLALPSGEPEDLLPFLHAAGKASTLPALEAGLPDGFRRLKGRRILMSLAFGPGNSLQLSFFVSARTLFAVEPAQLAQLAPQLADLGPNSGRAGLVAMVVDPSGASLTVSVGWCPLGEPSLTRVG